MNVKPYWEIKDCSKKQQFSLNILIKKIEPHKYDIWKLNNNYVFNGIIVKVNNLYPTKFPSIIITSGGDYEHIIIDLLGNCELGFKNSGISKFFTKKNDVESKVKEILCSGKYMK
jgi:hypothetical protein